MRISILVLITCCFGIGAYAQSPDLKVVASAGNSFVVQDLQLDWTLGEPVILTFDNSSAVLSQGFHQPDYHIITSTTWMDFNGEILLTPNPASNEITIDLSFSKFQSGLLILYDMTGKKIWSTVFSGEHFSTSYAIQDLSQGQYFIQTLLPATHESRLLHFIKM